MPRSFRRGLISRSAMPVPGMIAAICPRQMHPLIAMAFVELVDIFLQGLPVPQMVHDKPMTLVCVALLRRLRLGFVFLTDGEPPPREDIHHRAKSAPELRGAGFGFRDPTLLLVLVEQRPLVALRLDQFLLGRKQRLQLLALFGAVLGEQAFQSLAKLRPHRLARRVHARQGFESAQFLRHVFRFCAERTGDGKRLAVDIQRDYAAPVAFGQEVSMLFKGILEAV